MLKSLRILKANFARNLPRRQAPIKIDTKLKNLASSQPFQRQIKQTRENYQQQTPYQTLSQTLNEIKPQLGQRFKVNTDQMQKKIRHKMQKQMNMQNLQKDQDQSFQALSSKSYLYDQKDQIQFQAKFRHQIFKKKQTNRLIEKQKNNYKNYIDQTKNLQFNQYQKNVNTFKNSKIDSMMNFKRNNQQLRLLIDSGYIDNPKNIQYIMQKMNNSTLKLDEQILKQPQYQISQPNSFNQQTQIQLNQSSSVQLSQQNSKFPKLRPQTVDIHNKMMTNINGPQQLRNPQKLQQFFNILTQSTQVQKQRSKKDLTLLKKIKDFQTGTFQKRYEALNFRFKGQVKFDWMTQSQLLSYIKTQRGQHNQPSQLLQIFTQNKSLLSKHNLPIITPLIMSRIYSVCSLFTYPQTTQNNKINMLSSRSFIQLEKSLFHNVSKLSDQSFADCVFAYCRNHKEEQGVLRKNMQQRVLHAIFTQLNQRITSMGEQDLGLVLRAIIDTRMLAMDDLDWHYVTLTLGDRLNSLQKQFQFQTVINFLTLVPVTQNSIEYVQQNLKKFRQYKWQAKQTIMSFLYSSSFVIRYLNHLPAYKKPKVLLQLKSIVCSKHQQIMSITDRISINNMPQLLTILYSLDKFRPLQADYYLQIPSKLINKCKKQIIDNILQQKQPIKKYTLGSTSMLMAFNDYCKCLLKTSELTSSSIQILPISTLKSLFTFRCLPFNSINYFTYHQITKLISKQIVHLPIKSIVQSLFANSLVRYKNQGLFQEILGKLVERIYYQIKQNGNDQYVHTKYFREYVTLITTFHHNRIVNHYYYHFLYLVKNNASMLVKLQPNLLIRFFQTIVTLNFTTDSNNVQDYQLTRHFSQVFKLCLQNNLLSCIQMLSKQEILVLRYVSVMFQFVGSIQKSNNKQDGKVRVNKQKVENSLFKYLQEKILVRLQKQKRLTLQDSYLNSLSSTIYKMIITKQQDLNKILSSQFTLIQQKYYNQTLPTITQQQQQIGSQYKYDLVYQKVLKKIKLQNPHSIINQKIWRIQIEDKKEVYFLCTYQHLYAKYKEKDTLVRLFGIYKLYYQVYRFKGWTFNIVCTFLEG